MYNFENTFTGVDLIPENDSERLAALKRYDILYTPPEQSFDRIAAMARRLFKVPIALVAMVDADSVFFKANLGMEGTSKVSRGKSLCALAILQDEVTVFDNALNEPCLVANPLVAGEFGLRFYAGAPVFSKEGHRLGTVCIVDHYPREFSENQRQTLQDLSALVSDIMEMRLTDRRAQNTQKELLNIAAHDLKSPLNNIKALAGLLPRVRHDETGHFENMTERIVQASDDMSHLIQDLLTSGQLDADEYTIKPEPTDFSALVRHAVQRQRPKADRKKQRLLTYIQKDVTATVDPVRMSNVIENIVSNAIKYSYEAGKIKIYLERNSKGVELRVCDEGQGFSEQDLTEVFGKFKRLSARPTGGESSTGLGLSIVKQIVAAHGGEICINSEGKDCGCEVVMMLQED